MRPLASDRESVVLVVEDDPEIRYLLSVLLSEQGHAVLEADNAHLAEELLDERSPDLVVLDLVLPDRDGRQVLDRIREHPDTATVPVVVVSAHADRNVRQDCFVRGADHFVSKPFDPDELLGEISAVLERAKRRSPAPVLTDPASGFLNRAGIAEALRQAVAPSALALVRLDGLLALSERWGWQEAEKRVRASAEVIAGALPEGSRAGRLGGGEFVVLMPGADAAALADECEPILSAVRGVRLDDPDGEQLRLTVSISVVDVVEEAALDTTLDDARRRLFRAPASARNRVVSDDGYGSAGGLHVLVAEDDEISATILEHRLDREGLEVELYANGRRAYEAALERTPDLVILDVKMPGMGGFELLDRLRSSPAFASVPIMMLTSMGGEADVVRGFRLGADDYVLKPFSPVELSARVWRLLRRGRSREEV